MIKAAMATEHALLSQLTVPAAQVQPSGGRFFAELSAAHGEILRFSVLACNGPAHPGLSRKSPIRALELRN